ncbi:MAG: transglutaminase-like domain-containing protein [Oscillospiraceae bacterium]|nr:transglutaminase-like domain-containing protein [Oscillospiraceae bacterium]
MNNIGFNNPAKNTPEKNTAPVKPAVKTIYLDASGNMSRAGSFFGVAFLFLCVFAVCAGLILCVTGSFELELNMAGIMLVLTVSVLFFTLIYFLPSRIFTALAFLIAAGGGALYVILNYNIPEAAYYSLNLCLYRIQEAGYRIVVDNKLAETVNETTAGYLNVTAALLAVLLAALFCYFVYSKKNIIYSLLVSVAVVFPGFFYGLIPPYFAFSLVASFWVSQFAINIFESGHMAYVITKENTIPDKKLARIKLKAFKKQYRQNIKSIKSEIKTIVKSPNRNENFITLDKLIRQLKSVSPNERLFFMIYGLNDLKNSSSTKSKKSSKSNKSDNIVKSRSSKKDAFHDPIKAEKKRLKIETKEKTAAGRLQRQTEKKEFSKQPFAERLNIKFKNNIQNKKRFSVKSGYAGIFAFVTAFFAVTAVQPFISPQAKFDLSMPEKLMDFLTSTVEYTLVGSDASVYGGYNGGMGGGFLYRPGGAKFKDKPILKITSATDTNVLYLKSGAIYLKGWTGTIYTGSMWLEADKKQIEAYDALAASSPLPRFRYAGEQNFFRLFTESMQDIFGASYQRRGAELKEDKLKIEHLVAGGKRSFLPYFHDPESYGGGQFKFKKNADLYVQITNSLFQYPVYTVDFCSVDNVLNRAGTVATDDLKQYLDYYRSKTDTSSDIKEFLSLLNPDELQRSMPDAQFFSRSQFTSMSERRFDTLNEEGSFIEYSAPSPELADEPQYHGYIHIPHKYDEIIDIVKVRYNIYSGEAGGFVNQDFLDSEVLYAAFAREYYLTLPENFPAEVKNLALEITRGLPTDYEKALAVEKYLAQNYTYTLNPIIPADTKADFVYNFLFDQKEGYCTAYASAMVSMLRSLDIPSRYAEGYLVDASKKIRDENGLEYIIIYDYNGHAWPEVYFRGIGWLPFEPTVSYNDEVSDQEVYVYNPPIRLPSYESPVMPTEPEEEEDEDLSDEPKIALPAGFWVIVALIVACGGVYAANIMINSGRFRNFKAAKTNTAVLKMLSYLLVFLKYCGFVMHNEEGLKDFAARVAPNFTMIDPEGWTRIAVIMQKARYSAHEITDGERLEVYDFIEALRSECQKKLKFKLKFKLQFVHFVL